MTYYPLLTLNPTGEIVPDTGVAALELLLDPPKYFLPALKRRPPIDRFEAVYCSFPTTTDRSMKGITDCTTISRINTLMERRSSSDSSPPRVESYDAPLADSRAPRPSPTAAGGGTEREEGPKRESRLAARGCGAADVGAAEKSGKRAV